jgi:Icc-related predicted phosphoesterase
MRLHLLSDLHLEFQDFTPPATSADVVLLAGDIHVGAHGVAWAQRHFTCPVLYVPGNHEYYGGSLHKTLAQMKDQARGSCVHVLENEEVVIDGVRFLGGTLWTDYRLTGNPPLAQWDALRIMADFERIRDERFRKVKPPQLAARHQKTRAFFESRLSQPFAGPTVAISHHAPCELSIHERYRGGSGHLNASYASRLDALMGLAVLWVHGHTHDSFDYDAGGTRVVCNPRGYVPSDANYGFKPDLVLEV